MYTAPPAFRPGPHGDVMVSDREMDEAFDEFYVDAFVEMSKLGAVEELNVCANPGQHLAGNVYMKFASESQAAEALRKLNGRMYDGKPLRGELCPVTDFGEARCRQYSNGACDRRMCNFLHLKEPSSKVQQQLYRWQLEEWKKHRHYERPPPSGPPSMDRSYGGRHGYGGDRGGSDRYDRDRYDDRRGRERYDDRHDSGRRPRSPSPPPRYSRDSHRNGESSDPFGRDMRGAAPPPRYDAGPTSEERALEERLAQVRQQLAHSQVDTRKRERPEGGFDTQGPDHGPKQPRYGDQPW